MPTLVAPALDALAPFLAAQRIPTVEADMAARLLGPLCRGDDARWAVVDDEGWRLAGVVVDTCASADDVADLYPVAGDPRQVTGVELDRLLATAEQITAEGPRRSLEVALLPDRMHWAPGLRARGYELAYTLIRMRRPPTPVVEVTPPSGWRWAPVSPAFLADYAHVVRLAFANVPGTMIPEWEEFQRSALAARLPAHVLLRGAQDRVVAGREVLGEVVGYARVEERHTEEERILEVAAIGRHPALRGAGLGDVLLTYALTLALDQAPDGIELSVAAQNLAATALYQRHGFVSVEEIPVLRRFVR